VEEERAEGVEAASESREERSESEDVERRAGVAVKTMLG
jgi:hypothetical protein